MSRFFYLPLLLLVPLASIAEGTKELRPNPNNRGNLLLTTNAVYTDFAQFGAPPERQIKLRIVDTTETVYFGFNNKTDGGNFIQNVPYRILDPLGNIVIFDTMPGLGELGFINNWNEAVTGPNVNGNVNGYTPLSFEPKDTGDFVIEFDISNLPDRMNIHLIDFTVIDSADSVRTARLHSQGWQISTESFQNPFFGKVYPYDGGTAVYEVDFNSMIPYVFVINFNATGTQNTGDFVVDRQSVNGNFTYPEYEVFLNPPDSTLYPTQEQSISISAEVEKIDCATTEYCLRFSSTTEGELEGFIDLDKDGVFDPQDGEIDFSQVFEEPGTTCVPWDGTDANGNQVGAGEFQIISSFGFGVTHLPLYDVEHNRQGYIVDIIRPTNVPTPLLFWDDQNIEAGNTLGDNLVNLDGCNSVIQNGCHLWEDRGDINSSGNQTPETINTWWYATLEYDTVLYEIPEEFPVQLSFHTDTLEKGDKLVCAGDTLDFYIYNDGFSHFNDTIYTYKWWYNGSPMSDNLREQDQIVTGNATIVVEATENGNDVCISYDTLRVNAVNPIEIEATIIDENCAHDPGYLEVNITQGPIDAPFYWNDFQTNPTGLIGAIPAGTYLVSIGDSLLNPRCRLDTAFSIDSLLDIKIDTGLTTPTPCYSNDGTAIVLMDDPSRSYSYSWNGNSFQSSNALSNAAPGNQSISIRDNETGCTLDTLLNIPPEPFEAPVTKKDERCKNKKGEASIFPPSNGNFDIPWTPTSATTPTIENLSEGTYNVSLTATNNSTCRFETAITITNTDYEIYPDFSISEPLFGDQFGEGETIFFTNLTTDIDQATWYYGDGAEDNSINGEHVYDSIGNYSIRLVARDKNGCEGEIIKPIILLSKTPCDAALPTAFSPNNDGFNDDYGILGSVESLDLRIFNRWGELIFRTLEREKRWDGTFKGEETPIGVYPYTLMYECPNDEGKLIRIRKVGDVTLVR